MSQEAHSYAVLNYQFIKKPFLVGPSVAHRDSTAGHCGTTVVSSSKSRVARQPVWGGGKPDAMPGLRPGAYDVMPITSDSLQFWKKPRRKLETNQ